MKHTVAAAFAFAVLLLATDAVKPIHAQPVPNTPAQPSAGSANQTPAQRLIGGFAPKMVELTVAYCSAIFGSVHSCQSATAASSPSARSSR